MHWSLAKIVAVLLVYRYWFLFPIAVLEGPIISIIAGFLVSLGHLNFWLAYLVVVAGDLTGDTLYYWIGRAGRARFIPRWGKYFGITPARLAALEGHFAQHIGKTIFFGKFSQAAGAPILAAAGAARVPYWRFIWCNLLATLPKSILLLLVGYYFGRAYVQIDHYLSIIIYVLAVLLLAVAMWFLRRRQKAHPKNG